MLQWTSGYMYLFQFWFPHGICIGVGLLGHMVVLFLVFKGISVLSSIVAISIYIPTNSARAFPFLYTLSSIYCLIHEVAKSRTQVSDWSELNYHTWPLLYWGRFLLCQFFGVLIINGCWILSKVFSASIERIIWFLSFNLLT